MYGISQFRAMINPPENAILAIGAAVRKPIVIDDRDTVVVRPVIAFTLSADHRVIDGVVAARFLADLVKVVEHPEILLVRKMIKTCRNGRFLFFKTISFTFVIVFLMQPPPQNPEKIQMN